MKVWRSQNLDYCVVKLKDYTRTTMQELIEELYYQDNKNIPDTSLQIQLYKPKPHPYGLIIDAAWPGRTLTQPCWELGQHGFWYHLKKHIGMIAKEVVHDPNGGQRFQKVVEMWCKVPA